MRLIRIKTCFLILFYRYNFISIKNFIHHDHGHDQGTVTLRSGTVRYERSRSHEERNETLL